MGGYEGNRDSGSQMRWRDRYRERVWAFLPKVFHPQKRGVSPAYVEDKISVVVGQNIGSGNTVDTVFSGEKVC